MRPVVLAVVALLAGTLLVVPQIVLELVRALALAPALRFDAVVARKWALALGVREVPGRARWPRCWW